MVVMAMMNDELVMTVAGDDDDNNKNDDSRIKLLKLPSEVAVLMICVGLLLDKKKSL